MPWRRTRRILPHGVTRMTETPSRTALRASRRSELPSPRPMHALAAPSADPPPPSSPHPTRPPPGPPALLAAASPYPIWAVRYQPCPDLAVHLAAVSTLRHLHDPAFDVARYYQPALGWNPYWGYYGPVWLFSLLCSVETANRIVLSLYVIALP